jgi:pimeloyl-ACP methyl ester carboxylesterase
MAFFERGSGEPVVLVHGTSNDYRGWRHQTASPPAGFRLIAVSLRHYYPERWDGSGDKFSQTQHAEDLAAFIQSLGAGPVSLVGHSRGALVALRTAQARPDLVKKLVLMEAVGLVSLVRSPKPPTGAAASLPALRKAVAARFEQGDIEGGLEMWVDRDEAGSWKRMSAEDRQMRLDNARAIIVIETGRNKPIACSDVGRLQMPVLLMHGEKTPRLNADIMDAVHKCLPTAARAVIPDASHEMHQENPAAFEAALVKFLFN